MSPGMVIMNTTVRKLIFILCIVCWSIFFHTGIALSENPEKGNCDGLMSRIDFGNAYIMGQTIKSGAVYLMQRKQSDIQSMLKYRENYRDEILEDFVGNTSVKHMQGKNK